MEYMEKDDETLPVDEYNLLNVSHVVGISSHQNYFETSLNKGGSSSSSESDSLTSLKDNGIAVKTEIEDLETHQKSNCNTNFELETFGSLIKDEVAEECLPTVTSSDVVIENSNIGIDIEECNLLNEIKVEPDSLEETSSIINSISTTVESVSESSTRDNTNSANLDVINTSTKSKEKKTRGKLSKVYKKNVVTPNSWPNNNIDSLDPDIPLALLGCLTKRSVHLKHNTTLSDRDNTTFPTNTDSVHSTNNTRTINHQKTVQSYTDIINSCISQMSSDSIMNNILAPLKYNNMHDDKSKIFTPEPKKVCKQCGVRYHQVPPLIQHMTTSHPEVFACDVCGAQFNLKTSIRNHMDIHCKNKEYKCNECDFSSSSRSTYYHHRKQHTDCNIYKCEYCTYTSEYFSRVKHHQRCHFSQNNIQCSKCTYKTPYEAMLKRHMVCHSMERPFRCDECLYSSKHKYGLVVHKRTHSENTHFTCTVCQRGFKWACALSSHMLTHTKEKKYFCDKCSFSTARAMCLRRHEIKHLNSMQCTNCAFTTSSLKVLICHRIRRHKKNNLYSCPFCDFTSKNLRKTFQHKSVHLRGNKHKSRQPPVSKGSL